MQFSMETITQIQQLIVADLSRQMETEAASASQVEQALRSCLQGIGQASYGELLSQLDAQRYGVEATCAQCGANGKRVARRAAQVLGVFGWSSYRRSNYHCQACQVRWVALDQEAGLRAGQATPLMGSLLALAGITVSFEEAARQIEQYLQVQVSANTVRQETQRLGEKQAAREQVWLAHSQDLAGLQRRERDPQRPNQLYGSMDGAFVPLENAWQEAKTVSWYRAGRRYGESELHATDISYYTSLAPAASFGELLWGTGVHHRADQAAELIFVCDGAAWIWQLVRQYFPQAVQIVDWYHACQYLQSVAQALPLNQAGQSTWLNEMKDLLWAGDVEAILRACSQLDQQSGPALTSLRSYYGNNLERMRYADFRAKGYFSGSGTVESGCKQIVSMRLKRSGARWTEYGATMTAKARTAWLSHSWPELTQLPLAV